MSLQESLQRRLEQAQQNRRVMCFCAAGCEASAYYEVGANWPECNCWCHIPIWKERLKEAS